MRVNSLSQDRLTSRETQSLQEALNADYRTVNLRLREGEYQFVLASAIATFQLELNFPNVKELIERLYGKEKMESIEFRRKIQTVLKKMEKSNITTILPKKKPWELQRYGLSSFKFKDVNNNQVAFATDQQINEVQYLLHSMSNRGTSTAKLGNITKKFCILVFILVVSFTTVFWDLTQPTIDPVIFISAFSIAVACSIMLGKTLSQE